MRSLLPALSLIIGFLAALAAATQNVGLDSPLPPYDAIDSGRPVADQPIGHYPIGFRYVFYWLASAATLVFAATLARAALLRALSAVPSARRATISWYASGRNAADEVTCEPQLARSKLAASQHHQEGLAFRDRLRLRQAIRRQGAVPVITIRWWVWRLRTRERLEDAVKTATGWFGSWFSVSGGWSTAFPIPLIVVATALVLAGRPVRDQSARSERS